MRLPKKLLAIFLTLMLCAALGCGSQAVGDAGDGGDDGGDGGGGGGGGGGGTPQPEEVVFTPVGPSLAFDLIDIAFLPGQNGDALAIAKGGSVYYLRGPDFQVVGSPDTIPVLDNGERGLLNVEADPKYETNGYVYFYYTDPSEDPDLNKVERHTVMVDIPGNSFSLTGEKLIIQFQKDSQPPAGNHNGGGMVFMDQDHMAVGVGDGAVNANVAQDPDSRLGKIHRFIPSRDAMTGGLDPASPDNGVSNVEPTVYSLGLRNPFTVVVDALDPNGDLFLGDVGAGTAEEINCVYHAGENYGWPTCEGPCNPSMIQFQDPIHFYLHGDDTFDDEDPEANPQGPHSIMVNAFYTGEAYNGVFTGRLIYSEFYEGWVRVATLDAFERVTDTTHIGHQEGLITLQENPRDGQLYGVSLGGSDRILRMDLAP